MLNKTFKKIRSTKKISTNAKDIITKFILITKKKKGGIPPSWSNKNLITQP